MPSVGTISGKLVLNIGQWQQGVDKSLATTKVFQRDVNKIMKATASDTDRLTVKVRTLQAALVQGKIGWQQYGAGMALVQAEYLALNPQIVTATAVIQKQSLATKAATASLVGLQSTLTTFIGPLAAFFAVFKTLKMAEDVEQAMRSSLAIMRDVNDEMREEMISTARDVAFATKFSIKEGAEAYFFLASAGLDAEQSLAALPAVARFAQAGMFNLSLATDLLTDAQMAMGLSSKDAQKNLVNMTRVSDVLVKANTIANATVQQFSESLTNKGAAAGRLFGQSLEEVVAIMTVFASQGVKGVDAGSKFDILLRNLTIKANSNAVAFKRLGVDVYDPLTGKVRFLADIIGDLEDAFEGLTAKQQFQQMVMLGFGAKTITVTAALLGFSDAAKEALAELRDSTDETLKVSEAQWTAFSKGWNRVKGILESIAVVAGTPELEKMGAQLQLLTGGAEDMADAFKLVKESIGSAEVDGLSIAMPGLSGLAKLFAAEWDRVAQAVGMVVDGVELLIDIQTKGIAVAAIERATEHTTKQTEATRKLADETDRAQKNLGKVVTAAERLDKQAQNKGEILAAAMELEKAEKLRAKLVGDIANMGLTSIEIQLKGFEELGNIPQDKIEDLRNLMDAKNLKQAEQATRAWIDELNFEVAIAGMDKLEQQQRRLFRKEGVPRLLVPGGFAKELHEAKEAKRESDQRVADAKKLERETAAIEKGFGNAEKAASDFRKQLQFDKATKDMTALEKRGKRIKDALPEGSEEFDKVTKAVAEAQKRLDDIEKDNKLADLAKEADEEIKKVEKSVERLADKFATPQEAFAKSIKDLLKWKEILGTLPGFDSDQFDKAFANVERTALQGVAGRDRSDFLVDALERGSAEAFREEIGGKAKEEELELARLGVKQQREAIVKAHEDAKKLEKAFREIEVAENIP